MKAIGPDFDQLEQRALTIRELAERFVQPTAQDHVRWIDLSPQQARLVDSPLDIREMLSEQRQAAPKAWIFTSATLGDDDRLSWFTASTGLEDAITLRVGSPFDYAAHARLWVPLPFPKPNDTGAPGGRGCAGGARVPRRWADAPSCSPPPCVCCR